MGSLGWFVVGSKGLYCFNIFKKSLVEFLHTVYIKAHIFSLLITIEQPRCAEMKVKTSFRVFKKMFGHPQQSDILKPLHIKIISAIDNYSKFNLGQNLIHQSLIFQLNVILIRTDVPPLIFFFLQQSAAQCKLVGHAILDVLL